MTNSTSSGNMYNSDEFLCERISLAQLLAKNAQLQVPLPDVTEQLFPVTVIVSESV